MPPKWRYNNDDMDDDNLERTFEEIDRDNLIADVAKALFARWAERGDDNCRVAQECVTAAEALADELERRRANRGQ